VNGCAGLAYEAEGGPLDIYIMFDQSGSMLNDVGGLTRLQAVQQATAQFLRDPQSSGIGVGIGYFGVQPIGQVSCDPNVYRSPNVPIHDGSRTGDRLVERAACRPARPHLRGTVRRVLVCPGISPPEPGPRRGHPARHRRQAEAPVSCSNGGCCPTLDEATSVVSDCLKGNAGVPTYVLGVGPNLDNLSRIAQSGGTRAAYLVGDQNVAANVLNALNSIRGAAKIPCNLEIPRPASGAALDYGQVNVLLAPTQCAYSPVFHVQTAADCGADGGWYYDNPAAPGFVALCPSTCDLARAGSAGLKFSIGARPSSRRFAETRSSTLDKSSKARQSHVRAQQEIRESGPGFRRAGDSRQLAAVVRTSPPVAMAAVAPRAPAARRMRTVRATCAR
jgi:hypothetical protein